MRSRNPSPIGVGVLTVLTVLLVLILAVFSALTYSSAKADLVLSQKNADTVTAYYTAEAEARKLLDQFTGGVEGALEATLPMNEAQSLYIHLKRAEDGTVEIVAWKTIPAQEEDAFEEPRLPVFDGTLPGG